MALVLHAAAEQLQLRIIAPDRPGIGLSTPLPSRTVQQYPADLAELCDQLGGSEGGCEGLRFWVRCLGSGVWLQVYGFSNVQQYPSDLAELCGQLGGSGEVAARAQGVWVRFLCSSERHCSDGLHQQLVSLLQLLAEPGRNIGSFRCTSRSFHYGVTLVMPGAAAAVTAATSPRLPRQGGA